MSNNKNNSKSRTGTVKAKKVDVPMTKKQKIFTLVASILIVAIVAGAVVMIVRAIRGVHVDFMKDNLSRYISISPDDYTNIVVDIPLEEYDEQDLVSAINRILAENKSSEPKYNGAAYKSEAITLGDVVSIMYRGYYVDGEGKTVEISSNFASGESVQLEIGSGKVIGGEGNFLPGFTDGMLGIVPSDYTPFKLIGDGKVEDGDVIYLSYTAFYPDDAGSYKQASAERIDLSEDIDAIYGKGFKAFLLGTAEGAEAQSIGTKLSSKTFPYGTGSAGYSDMVIEDVTRGCESAPLTLSVTFPADYSDQSLSGVEAKFDVYISNAVIYDTPELNEAFITETLKLTAEDLKDYEGIDLVEKYKNRLVKDIKAEIDEVNEQLISDSVWATLLAVVEVKKLPNYNVDEYYKTYYNEVEYYYSLYNSYYNSLDEAALDYLSYAQGVDWRAQLKEKAKNTVLEEMLFYYIIREEKLMPSKDEFAQLRQSIIDAHYKYHIDLNSEELSKLSGDEYNVRVAQIKAEVLEYYSDEYFDSNVYYNYGMDKIIEKFVVLK